MAKNEQAFLYDGILSLEGGMNSGVVPQLLQPNQTFFSTNATHRGGYITQRARLKKLKLDFGNDLVLETQSTRALFQGACFYQPDTGSPALVSLIAGRLFTFTPDNAGNAVVADVSIPTDLDSATATQAWLWQAERWVIVQNGQDLPLFFDGSTTRRSFGPSQLLDTIAAPGFTSPALGASIQVNVTNPYNGPFEIPVLVIDTVGAHTGRYTLRPPAPLPNTPNARLKLITGPTFDSVTGDVPSVSLPIGSAVFAMPSRIGLAGLAVDSIAPDVRLLLFGFSDNPADYPLTTWNFASQAINVSAVTDAGTVPFKKVATATSAANLTGTLHQVITYNNPNPNSLVGTTTAAFNTPVRLSTVDVVLNTPYTGADNQPVWIGNYLFLISKIATTPASTVTLVNTGDSVGYAYPATTTQIATIPELPAGRMGDYGLGRIWMSLVDGRSFIASDIVGGSSGSITYNNRDAILKITENTFLAGGGTFVVPGSVGDIRFMRFTSTLDVSLGQGPLQVGTAKAVFSCMAPVDRLVWQDVTNPILTQSLIGNGGLAQDSTIVCNGDLIMRSIDGIRSLVLARREFDTWGNVPQSRELQEVIKLDDTSLLQYGSGIQFDNRALMTGLPSPGPLGTVHQGLYALNFDPLSSLRGKAASVYDGLWTGLNVLKLVTGVIAGVQRAFAFCYSASTAAIELYEILPSEDTGVFDNDTTPITWSFESASLFGHIKGKGPLDFVELLDGELWVKDIVGPVTFQVFYKPDYSECWSKWHEFRVCANNITSGPKQFRTRLGLGEPSIKDCEPTNNRPYRIGATFQIRVQVSGAVKVMGAIFKARPTPMPDFATPICEPLCIEQ